jgi:hypothetical protein
MIVRGVTTVPAATRHSAPISALSRITEPMPMSAPSPIFAP